MDGQCCAELCMITIIFSMVTTITSNTTLSWLQGGASLLERLRLSSICSASASATGELEALHVSRAWERREEKDSLVIVCNIVTGE